MQLKLVPSGERYRTTTIRGPLISPWLASRLVALSRSCLLARRQCRYYCSSCLANSTNPGLMLRRSKRPVDDDEDDDDADEEEDDGKGE
jgi:hypothetical protein